MVNTLKEGNRTPENPFDARSIGSKKNLQRMILKRILGSKIQSTEKTMEEVKLRQELRKRLSK